MSPAGPVWQRARSLLSGRLQLLVLVIGLCVHVLFQLGPAKDAVWNTKHGRDFASYYYAVQVAGDGGNPYRTRALDAMAKAEHTRGSVQPFFYPPPFLYTVAWAQPLPLATAYRLMLVLNEVLLAACLFVLARGFAIPLGVLGALLIVWSPIPDNAKMGQANLIALLPALLGLWAARTRPWLGGVLLGAAAMFKMSPALFLLYWALRRQWRPCVAAVLTAIGLSVVSLPICPLATQIEFYTRVMPGFASGDYHGLTVPISLSANHSIPDIFNTLWPGPSKTALSPSAILGSRVVTGCALALWAWRTRLASTQLPEPGGLHRDARTLGALTVLMVIVPTYTYEHHLVFLLLPVSALLASVLNDWVTGGGLRLRHVLAILAVVIAGWPLHLVTELIQSVPHWAQPWVREGKFVALLVIFGLLLGGWKPRDVRG